MRADRKLKKFLRNNKVLTKFKLNCKNIENGMSLGEGVSCIGSAFVWSKSPEGREFWSNLEYRFLSENRGSR